MTISITTVANNQTFGTWLARTNELCGIVAANTVTVDSTTIGSLSTGNGFVNGYFGSTLLYTSDTNGNVTINSISINTSWGFSANSSSITYSRDLFANNLYLGSNINVINSSGLYAIGGLYSNSLTVDGYFSVNSTQSYAANLTVGGYTNVVSISIQNSLNVGSLEINSSAITLLPAVLNSSSLFIGSNTSNITPFICLSNSIANVVFSPAGILTSWGLSINTSGMMVGPIVSGNLNGLYSSNLTLNNSIIVVSGTNTALNASMNSSSLFMGNSTFTFISSNSEGIFTNGSVTMSGNLFVTGNITSTGTSVANGNFIPVSNSYNLGNSTCVWTLWALGINAVSNSIFQYDLTVSNTLLVGNSTVNSSLNSTFYSATSNNTSFVGSVSAANVVSNAQLESNLTAYQTTAGLNANITSYLQGFSVTLAACSISIGSSSANLDVTSNVITISNATSNITLSIPTASQSSNTQYFFNANGSWVYSTTSNGSFTVNSISATVIDSYLMANYRGAKYIVSCIDNNANNRYFTELLTTHDTSSGYITEYGMITTNSVIGTFSAGSNSTCVLVQFTSASSTNVTITFIRSII